MKDEEYAPDMPPLGGAGYLVSHLFEVGPVMAGGFGPVPLSFQELQAYQEATGLELQRWEVLFLRRLSSEYLTASSQAGDLNCPAPWGQIRSRYTASTMREQIAALAEL